jgi:hypothetical protein
MVHGPNGDDVRCWTFFFFGFGCHFCVLNIQIKNSDLIVVIGIGNGGKAKTRAIIKGGFVK